MTQNRTNVLAAQHYCKLGLNALPMADPDKTGTKHPNIPWKAKSEGKKKGFTYQDYTVERWALDAISSHESYYSHGIVGISGINNYHVIDGDSIVDFAIVDEILALLGLPPNYPWVVNSGSLRGVQIWFENEEELPKDIYDYSARDAARFNHVELRWRGNCCVLPPSKHPSGNHYLFREGEMPTSPPSTVSLPLIMNMLDTIGIIRHPEKSTKTAAQAQTNDKAYQTVKSHLTVMDDNGDDAEVECPWASEHGDGRPNAHIWRNEGGKPEFNCFHGHCDGRRWAHVLEFLGLAPGRVILGRQLSEEVDAILDALYAANNPPVIFVRGGCLNRVCLDEDGKPRIEVMTEHIMLAHITRSADFFREEKGEPDEPASYRTAHPSAKHATQVLAQGTWKFPTLAGITEVPIIRPDGTILASPGYDPGTHLYYIPQPGLDVPAIPDRPTKEDVRRAADYIGGFIGDFPYVAESDSANTYGLLLTTVTRDCVRHVPMPTITATKQGTGKGLLTDLTSTIATGYSAASLSEIRSEEEWDKRITALLMAGTTSISIDNVEGTLRSATLSHVLTADYYTGRILGLSKMATVAQRAIFVANGNNILLGGDLPRRCYPIRMAVQVSDPWKREGFKYPDLIKSVTAERGKIIAALLTMVRGWWVAGRPAPAKKLARLGTFSEWVDLVGGVLAYAGIDRFLENLDEMHKGTDVDGNAWALFLETWYTKLGEESYTTKALIEKLTKDADFADTLPEPLGTLFLKEDKSLSRKMGRALAKKKGTPFGSDNLRIEQDEDTDKKVAKFRVTGYTGYTGYKTSLRENFFENEKEKEKNGSEAHHTPYTPYTPCFEESENTNGHVGSEAKQPPHTPQSDEQEAPLPNDWCCITCGRDVEDFSRIDIDGTIHEQPDVPYCLAHKPPELELEEDQEAVCSN